ncbi:MAG: putative toxin-antitoxin system toxin component, PIN family [Chloroflexi bacterium]|nr:putative toxin-antitoxin system toxin component, PIN family [Chloroflexota bacterium]
MRVVLDTNVIVSGLNFPGNERLLLDLALRGRIELYLSPFILDEVFGVLARKFGWADDDVQQALRRLRQAATVIHPPRFTDVIEGDHADNRVLECAVAVSADYLVTGDRRHLLPIGEHRGVRILRSPQFISALGDG